MPNKTNKSKADGKGKKKKGKKGAKAKQENRDEVLKQAISNALLWENRLHTTETVNNEYRHNTHTLLRENEKLQTQVEQAEKDTVQVIGFLRDEDIKKNNEINKLQSLIKQFKRDYRKEKQDLIDQYTSTIEKLEVSLSNKTNEAKLMQSELKLVKEFRRKRAQMQKEIDDIKESLHVNNNQHRETLETMEKKFFNEKIRMQQETSRKISELADRAHTEAVNNLDETTRSIYKENVRLNEALNYHMTSREELTQINKVLESKNKKLSDEKEMNSLIVEEKVAQAKRLQKQTKEFQNKIVELEEMLTQIIEQNNQDKLSLVQKHKREEEENQMEITRLMKTVGLKTKEMNRVKKIAKNILDQRSDVERFFLDSLDIVRAEIARNRSQYRRDAEVAYHRRMLEANAGRVKYPKVRTFKESKHSTNNVFADLEEAEQWDGITDEMKIDISELTWEQRERVFRLLFVKINGHKEKPESANRQKSLPPMKMCPVLRIKQPPPSTLCTTDAAAANMPSLSPLQKAFMTEAAEEHVSAAGTNINHTLAAPIHQALA